MSGMWGKIIFDLKFVQKFDRNFIFDIFKIEKDFIKFLHQCFIFNIFHPRIVDIQIDLIEIPVNDSWGML